MQLSAADLLQYKATTHRPPMATTTKQTRYAIARWDDDGWMRLSWFATYAAADAALDRWADRYPNAWVDIIDMKTNELAAV